MTATPPDDVDALFDLPPASSQPTDPPADDTQSAEAALAAEMASTLEAGGVATDAPDSRTNLRVEVSWPARMHLPDGQVIELKVRNISEGGLGLVSREPIPAYTVVNLEMGVPPLDEGGQLTPVTAAIKTTYTVAQGSDILCGSAWQVPPAGLEIVSLWIKRLRR
jgi:hypothetical protein